jgi:hypothetical protein
LEAFVTDCENAPPPISLLVDESNTGVDLNIKNREKQLFKPLIRLFQKEECLDEILKVISEYISKKRAASVDSLQAYLYKTMKKMMISQNTTEFESSVIWQTIKDDLRGVEVKGKPMSMPS